MASATEDLPQDLQVQLAGYIAGIGRANPTWDLSRVRVEFGNQIESFFNRIQPPSASRTRSQPSRPLYPSHGLQQQFPQHGPGSQRHSTDFGHTPGEAAAPNDFFRPRTSRSTRASNHNAETEHPLTRVAQHAPITRPLLSTQLISNNFTPTSQHPSPGATVLPSSGEFLNSHREGGSTQTFRQGDQRPIEVAVGKYLLLWRAKDLSDRASVRHFQQ